MYLQTDQTIDANCGYNYLNLGLQPLCLFNSRLKSKVVLLSLIKVSSLFHVHLITTSITDGFGWLWSEMCIVAPAATTYSDVT